jgi:Glyoxalase-like domain
MVREQEGKHVHRTGRRQRRPRPAGRILDGGSRLATNRRYQGAVEIAGPPGSGPSLTFVPVPEAKRVKNRLHIDVNPVGCDQEQEVERRIGLGARQIDIGQGEQSWVVLADPAGNAFCVLRSRVE